MESRGRRHREASPATAAAVIPSGASPARLHSRRARGALTSLTAQHRKETAADHPSGSPGRPQDNTWARGASSQSGQNCPARGSPRLLATDGSRQLWNCARAPLRPTWETATWPGRDLCHVSVPLSGPPPRRGSPRGPHSRGTLQHWTLAKWTSLRRGETAIQKKPPPPEPDHWLLGSKAGPGLAHR